MNALAQVIWWDEEDRTPDLRIANATLSQLSYHPVKRAEFYLLGWEAANSAQNHGDIMFFA